MSKDDREQIITALQEGIAAAHNACSPTILLPWDNYQTYAQAALASLKAAGFKIVRDA